MNEVIMYTDGACKGNPGKGGWGVYISYNGHTKELFGGEDNTTNNRMELMAAIQGLNALTKSCSVLLHTDSNYVLQGITQWLPKWKLNNFISNKKPIKNQDLWKMLDEANSKHNVTWIKVKGHSGDVGNDIADMLANKGCGV